MEVSNHDSFTVQIRGAFSDGIDITHSMTATPITNQIRRLRFDKNEMTQEALARACGVTRQTIIALEAGRYAPSLELAFKISRVFGVGVEDVFHYFVISFTQRLS